ncbi:MAG: invasion associated locus B family protein [Terriglobia bacterium]
MRLSVLIAACFAIAGVPANAADKSIEESSGDWRISCFDDNFTGYRDCYVIRDSLSVLVSGMGYEIVIVGLGYDRPPESEAIVQVDENAPLRWRQEDLYADGTFSKAIRQFRAGQTAQLQFLQGPSETQVGAEISLIGFTKAYQRAKRLVRDYKT